MTIEEMEAKEQHLNRATDRSVCDDCQLPNRELTTRPTFLGGTLIYLDGPLGPRQVWVDEKNRMFPVEDVWGRE